MDGLSSRPIKNWSAVSCSNIDIWNTYIVDVVAGITTKSEKSAWTERGRVAKGCLDNGHGNSRGDEADEFIVQESEGLGPVVVYNAQC